MILYIYFDDTAPHGVRAYPSLRKVRAARAKAFSRQARPEILKVDIGPLTRQTACNLLTGENYAKHMEDIR